MAGKKFQQAKSATPPMATGPRVSTVLSHSLLWILAFRLLNALTIRTFFQPDEFFQSLEPAWKIAFGHDAGAWITWEWRTYLRSSMHPTIFAAAYSIVDWLSRMSGGETSALRSELLLATPKILQAFSAALCDHYTWKFADQLYGKAHRAASFALILTICSPWHWFCSTRTLSNCLETTLTIAALNSWPWHVVLSNSQHYRQPASLAAFNGGLRKATTRVKTSLSFRYALFPAAIACILRPTNTLIWLCITSSTLLYSAAHVRVRLVLDAILCGFVVLGLSAISDRAYYGLWSLPPLRFLYFNVAQSLAVFYGRNRVDYYFTEGLPLLLTTALPFAATGLWWQTRGQPYHLHSDVTAVPEQAVPGETPTTSSTRTSMSPSNSLMQRVLRILSATVAFVTFAMSCISHKEVRFLYPILPALHVIAAGPLAKFTEPRQPQKQASLTAGINALPLFRKIILSSCLAVNVALAIYVTQYHQRGVIDVIDHLRRERDSRISNLTNINASSVGFLMPCHSTPWRSHLVYADIDAWALTCEPPLNVPLSQRAEYMDEADQFYDDPMAWMDNHIGEQADQRPWPDKVVFFEQLEVTMREYFDTRRRTGESRMQGLRAYNECWRGFNTHFHDDWRRYGDIIVWCAQD